MCARSRFRASAPCATRSLPTPRPIIRRASTRRDYETRSNKRATMTGPGTRPLERNRQLAEVTALADRRDRGACLLEGELQRIDHRSDVVLIDEAHHRLEIVARA